MVVALDVDLTLEKSDFCWAEGLAPGRNQFVSFERRFDIGASKSVEINLFADTRYRLFVNDDFVAYGPGRFVTAHPEFDTYDISTHLRHGQNVVRVEVNYFGCSSFQTMPDGLPGFIAAGGTKDGVVDFQTPGAWLSIIHKAWDSQSPYFSFAQNPAEICDTRTLDVELTQPARHAVVALGAERTPWLKPVPRSAPYPDYKLVRPARIMAAGPASPSLRWGCQLHRSHIGSKDKEYVSFITWIHSPRRQSVSLDIFWTEGRLNDVPLEIRYTGRLGNHGESTVELREGWNFLGGNYEILTDQWSFLVGLPIESGATLHARPDLFCEESFAFSGPLAARETPSYPASTKSYFQPHGWTAVSSDLNAVTPARMTAWDTPVETKVVRDQPYKDLSKYKTQAAHTAIWAFDFGDEYYGQPYLDVEAPVGTTLDVAYDDWSRADGCVNLYNSNPFT